jgi:hypothetical protein
MFAQSMQQHIEFPPLRWIGSAQHRTGPARLAACGIGLSKSGQGFEAGDKDIRQPSHLAFYAGTSGIASG